MSILFGLVSTNVMAEPGAPTLPPLSTISCPAIAKALGKILKRTNNNPSALIAHVAHFLDYSGRTNFANWQRDLPTSARESLNALRREFFFSDPMTQAAVLRLLAVGVDSGSSADSAHTAGTSLPMMSMSELQMIEAEAIHLLRRGVETGPNGNQVDIGKSARGVIRMLATFLPNSKRAHASLEEGKLIVVPIGKDTDYWP